MKKTLLAILATLTLTTPALACPAWECQLGLDDWSCGGVHGCSNQQVYDETTTYNQYIYCPYCGHEMWDCVCGTYQESYSGDCGSNYDCNYNYDYSGDCGYSGYFESYSESYSCGGSTMSHWANVRDCYGNIIGQIGTGSSVEVCGQDPSNPDRVLVYDYCTGTYGSVLSDCVYGGYTWDGSGDNGIYNSYQGGCNESYQGYGDSTAYSGDSGYYGGDCSEGYTDCSSYDGGCGGYGVSGCYDLVRYTEAIQIVRSWEMTTGCVRTCW